MTKRQENSTALKSEEKAVGERWEKHRVREWNSDCQKVCFSHNLKALLVVRESK